MQWQDATPRSRLSSTLLRFSLALALLLLLGVRTSAQHCDQSLWQHVYHPARLKVIKSCVTVSGRIMDATNGKRKDGVRHEKDGDPHGWLKPNQSGFTNSGNDSTQNGNLVYEIPCLFPVTQADAIASCKNYKATVKLVPIGSCVEITGTLVEDLQHQPVHREIHPVTSIVIKPCQPSQ